MPKRMSKAARERFLREPRICVLATIGEDGRPVLTPIWYLFRGGRVLMRTSRASEKARNIERDPRVTVCIQDERPPYRNMTVYGTATLEPAEEGLDTAIARRYLGAAAGAAYLRTARESTEQGDEITISVTPERIVTQDYGPETPLAGRLWLLAKRFLPPGL
jgi:PPOX class probable F420-dependent enzyme